MVDQPRLFPRRADIRWERRIHEVINPALDRSGIITKWTNIIVKHTGYVDPVVHERKRQRNLLLLQRELAERPDDPFTYYYLGTLAFERERWKEALGYFILSQAKWGTTESIACKLFAMIAWTNQILNRFREALRVCEEGLHYFPNDGELWFRKAVAHRYLLQPKEAEHCWRTVLDLGRPNNYYNVDEGIYGHLTLHNLAIVAEELGDPKQAKIYWRRILEDQPDYSAALQAIRQKK